MLDCLVLSYEDGLGVCSLDGDGPASFGCESEFLGEMLEDRPEWYRRRAEVMS